MKLWIIPLNTFLTGIFCCVMMQNKVFYMEDIKNEALEKSKDKTSEIHNPEDTPSPSSKLLTLWENIIRFGLSGAFLRASTGIISLLLILLFVIIIRKLDLGSKTTAIAEPTATSTVPLIIPTYQTSTGAGGPIEVAEEYPGITRDALLHTMFPVRPRTEVISYTVQEGDTVFGIAEKFNLKPETILWGNYYTLADDPHNLTPGQELNIMPTDGVYYEWHAGDGLNGVSEAYGVTPEDIINWGSNNLSMETIGDYMNPNIEPGTWIFVPGGSRGFVTWSAPRISRDNPAVAKNFGPGACGEIMDGPVGSGTYVWPTTARYISGYNYSPESNHPAIDIGGQEGNAIYAVDNGVVVYAGWNDYGYGNMIVVDHGYGWQSLYAHLSALNVACGSYVYQGNVIGYMGTTGNSSGPHLHFELMSETYGKVNPLNFLQ
jgi:murein DD-endopeptidase MepM/ murein hydrolase activator NlpD